MKEVYLQFLVCPECKNNLLPCDDNCIVDGEIEKGELICETCSNIYPIINHIPRFAPQENYTQNFGYEWQKHARTQYDTYWGANLSEKRFFDESKWPRSLPGELILEVGCGSGRFTEHAISTGAMVISLDYSNAVEVNYASNGGKENSLIVQADLYHMPFRENSFDKIFCFGVLQHTPDVKKAFFTLPSYLKTGGRLAIDVYPKSKLIWQILKTKYWVRPFTKNMEPDRLYHITSKYVNFMWPLSRLIGKLPYGWLINKAMLIANYQGLYNLRDDAMKEWAILDTFDMLSPAYDNPQSIETVKGWFTTTRLQDVEVQYGYNGIEGRARKR